MANPYDIPPVQSKGSYTAEEVYTAVGCALSKWERLEEALAELFAVLCQSRSLSARLAYGAAVAGTTRNDMLKAAAASFYFGDQPAKERALKLIDFVGKLSGRRNDIAHGMVVQYMSPGTPFDGFYLTPPSYQTRKGSRHTIYNAKPTLDPKYQYTADQIYDFAKAFDDAESSITAACLRAL